MKSVFALLGLAALTTVSVASVKFNEFLINPPGTDNGQEFFELKSSGASESLSGLWLIVVEGDFAANGQTGLVTLAMNLTAAGSTGSNRLALIRDAQTVLLPAPNGNTTIYVEDFNPDVQNGSQTMLLVRGFTGNSGQDLDTDNNGVLDITPWTSVEQAIAWTDGGATDLLYANQFSGTTFPATGWGVPAPQAYALVGNVNAGIGITGASPGPYTVFQGQIIDNNGNVLLPPANWSLTPGSENTPFTSSVNPSSYVVQTGLDFGGTLASLFSSDDNKVVVLCDEFTTNGQVEITTTGIATASVLTAICEMSSSRTDVTQFTKVKNVGTNNFDQIDARTTTNIDTSFSANVPNPGNYLNGGTIVAQVLWIPSQDIDAGDGWTYSIDQFVFDVAP